MRTVFGLSIPRPEKESVGRAHCGRGVAIVRARHAVRRALGTTARAVLPEAVRIPAWVVWRYAQRFGVLPNLLAPKTFNEKILHRILFDRRPILTTLQDKYAVREYVRARIGAHVLPEMYWATNDPSTIPFDTLPRKFVVKPTHASGWAELVVDKASVNPRALVETCRGWLRQNYYYAEGEWVYKNIEPRIIVEEFIDDGTGSVPTDYKLFVFDGRVELIAIHVDRFANHRSNVYGRSWNKLDVMFSFPNTERDVDPPKHLREMIAYAEALGRGLDFVRVDLYDTDEKVYFGEITTTPGGAMDTFHPVEFDRQLGEMWHLSSGCGLRTRRRRRTDATAGGVWRDGPVRR